MRFEILIYKMISLWVVVLNHALLSKSEKRLPKNLPLDSNAPNATEAYDGQEKSLLYIDWN